MPVFQLIVDVLKDVKGLVKCFKLLSLFIYGRKVSVNVLLCFNFDPVPILKHCLTKLKLFYIGK